MEAFERFFLAEHPKLVALGLAWTGDGDTARDLAQEALVRAHRSWDRVERLDIPGAWVRRVMINLLIDRRRDERRAARPPRPAHPDGPGRPDRTSTISLVGRRPGAARAGAGGDHPALRRGPFDREVAEILEITPGTVKATLSHARDKLPAALTDQEDDR